MKLLYISVHGVLEWLELSLFTELGIECFSMGEYIRPDVPEGEIYLHKRPGIKGMKSHPELEKFAIENPSTNIPKELIDWCDAVMIMHDPNVIVMNWDKFKAAGKPVIWRSIGQSTSNCENQIRRMRYDGMKIVRMSPFEERIPGYLGADSVIRFHSDSEELNNWNGDTKRIINCTQSLLGRRVFCHHDQIMQIMDGFPAIVYGSGNSDLGGLNGGELPWDLLKGALRDNRAFIFGGTFPSPYTLAVLDAMMTGMPIVALGSKLAQELPVAPQDNYPYYEMGSILEHGRSGFVSDDINELRNNVHQLLEDPELAKRIGEQGRRTAMRLFDKDKAKAAWKDFFDTKL